MCARIGSLSAWNSPKSAKSSTQCRFLQGRFIIGRAVRSPIPKLAGFHVIMTASPKNFDLVKDLGADEVFDYCNEGVIEKIHTTTGNTLDLTVNTVSEGKMPEQVGLATANTHSAACFHWKRPPVLNFYIPLAGQSTKPARFST
ncbi:hypothetical protein EI94DRAFT_1849429 [Lactarius quietus]|nr:hypothetical protein EI94DRAFT_1849429 [Lactarius quietus]